MDYIVDTIKPTEIQDIFGIVYTSLNNRITLTDNYNSILSKRGYLINKLYSFLKSDNLYTSLTSTDIDLLCFNTPKYYNNSYIQYCDIKDITLFKTLKKLSLNKLEFNEDDYKILYSFIRNHRRVEDIIRLSSYNSIVLDKCTIDLILSLVTKKVLPNGHIISLYESLCNNLNLNIEDHSYKLEYKPN